MPITTTAGTTTFKFRRRVDCVIGSTALRSSPGSFLHGLVSPVHHRIHTSALHRSNLCNRNRNFHLSRFFESQGQRKGFPFLPRLLYSDHPHLQPPHPAPHPPSR